MGIITKVLTAVIPKRKTANIAEKTRTSIRIPETMPDSFELTSTPAIHTNVRLAQMLSNLPASRYSRKQECQAVINKFIKGGIKREQLYLYLLQNAYHKLRIHQYELVGKALGFEMLTGRNTRNIGVLNREGWHYRIPLYK
ncbi:MAG: hypothetical protein PHE56_16620, partial [Bacteroidales bacterium]|nr:hypothetical protein [Bacteroidales bacterium]